MKSSNFYLKLFAWPFFVYFLFSVPYKKHIPRLDPVHTYDLHTNTRAHIK